MTREALYKVSREGTVEHSFMKIAQELTSSYAIQTLNDYVQLFFYDKQSKSLTFEAGLIKESDEKELKKFISSFTQPMIDDISTLLSKTTEEIDVEILGIILQTVHQDFKAIKEFVSRGIRGGYQQLSE